MLDMPILKFEKSTNYLNNQLEILENNKQLVTDIIANIGLFLDKNSKISDVENYLNIKKSANNFLELISKNITTTEELSREIKHITYDLTEILAEASRKEKSKEYYIATISNIKNNIENYTSKFQDFEQKIEKDNTDFNEFINVNNIKYNFVSNPENNSFEFSSFSIDNVLMENFNKIENNSSENTVGITAENEISQETIENEASQDIIENEKDLKIDELTTEFKGILTNLSEDAVLSLNLISALNLNNDENQKVSDETKQDKKEPEVAFKPEETTNNDDSSNIVIDYSSIYGNYFKNAKTIEENISSEYSNFDIGTSSSKLEKKSEPLFILNDDETLENKLENNESIVEKNDILNEMSDDDILTELLLQDTNSNNIENLILNFPSEGQNISDEINDLEGLLIDDKNDLDNLLIDNENSDLEDSLLIDDQNNDLDNILENDKNEDSNNLLIDDKRLNSKKLLKGAKITTSNEICNNFSNFELEERIKIIKEGTSNNDSLIISEKKDKIFLPYSIDELEKYLKSYPEVYNSVSDVIEQEFTLSFNDFLKHPAKTRFVETYNLIRNRERKSIFTSLLCAFKLIGKYNLNPAIIAACKNAQQLETYLYYLNSNNLNKFKIFKIIYEINPLKI